MESMVNRENKASEEKKPNVNYEAFMKHMKELHDIAKLADEIKDNRVEIKEKAKKTLRDYAYSQMPENKRPENADKLNEQTVQIYVEFSHRKAEEDSANVLYKNLESIVDSEMPRESLAKLAGTKEIGERADEKEKNIFEAYARFKGIEDLAKRYEEGKKLSKEETEMVRDAAIIALGDKLAEGLKEKGYSSDIQDYVREKLAPETVARGYLDSDKMKEYALPGFKKLAEQRKKDYEKLAEKSGTVADAAGEILKKMAKGSREEFDMARNMIYGAAA